MLFYASGHSDRPALTTGLLEDMYQLLCNSHNSLQCFGESTKGFHIKPFICRQRSGGTTNIDFTSLHHLTISSVHLFVLSLRLVRVLLSFLIDILPLFILPTVSVLKNLYVFFALAVSMFSHTCGPSCVKAVIIIVL